MQKLLKSILATLKVGIFLILSLQSAHAAVSLVTDSAGNLLGANGIVIDDNIYNVRFQDGSWPGLNLSVMFSTDGPYPSQIERASKALLDHVFVGNYDTNPALTNGCSDALDCLILTPSSFFWNGTTYRAVAQVTYNNSSVNGDTFNTTTQFNYYADTSLEIPGAAGATTVWAVWSNMGPVSAVPEPSSLMMLIAGFGLLISKKFTSSGLVKRAKFKLI